MLKELIETDATLANDGYKDWCYARLAIHEAIEFFGTLRITKKKTLNRWKRTGEYQKLIDSGYIYAEGCGRFNKEKCECTKCRRLQAQKDL